MPDYAGISTLASAITRIFTRTYDVSDLSGLVNFLRANLVPAGTIQFTLSAATLPAGWLAADGSTVEVSDYPDLFAAIGYTYGGSGNSFRLPDFRNRIPIGAGSIAAAGATAGSQTATLTTNNMPVHSHQISQTVHSHTVPSASVGGSSSAGSDATTVALGTGTVAETVPIDFSSGQTGSGTAKITVEESGSGQAFSIIPPVFGVQAIIKV